MKHLKKLISSILIVAFVLVISPYAFSASICEDGNHKYNIKSIIPATSDHDGEIIYICSKCELTYTKILLASSKKEWEIVSPATCTKSGLVKHYISPNKTDNTSSNFENSELITIPPKGHSYSVEVFDSTCTKAGYKKFHCSDCSDTFTEIEPALGHTYIQIEKDGETISECQRCGDIYKDGLPAATVPSENPVEDPNNSNNHEHSYRVFKRTDPTCETEGTISYKCKACGDSYEEQIEPLGHNYGDFEVIREPSFTHHGLIRKTCKNDITHTLTEKTPRVISFKITTTVLLTTYVNLAVIVVFFIIIWSDIHVILWDSRIRRKMKEQIILERRILLKKLNKRK